MHQHAQDLGEPDLSLAGFQLWIHGHDADEDWLRVTAHCGAAGASVWASGQILQLADIVRFEVQCGDLETGQVKAALLASHEPNLSVELKRLGSLGEIEMTVQITPDHMSQEHRFTIGIDLSYVPDLRRRLTRISTRLGSG